MEEEEEEEEKQEEEEILTALKLTDMIKFRTIVIFTTYMKMSRNL
jgi:hypothetical protein